MYLIIAVRHNIFKYNVMGIILRWKNLNYMLEIDILRNDAQKCLCVLSRCIFEGLGVQMMPRRPAGSAG